MQIPHHRLALMLVQVRPAPRASGAKVAVLQLGRLAERSGLCVARAGSRRQDAGTHDRHMVCVEHSHEPVHAQAMKRRSACEVGSIKRWMRL